MPAEPPINPYKAYISQTQLLQKAFEAVVLQNEKTVAAMKKGIAKDYAVMLKNLKYVVSAAHENYANPQTGKLNYQELVRFDRIKKLDAQIDSSIRDNYAPIKKRIIADQKRIIEDTHQGTSEAVIAAAGLGIKPPMLTGVQINEILSRPWSGVSLAEKILLRQNYLGIQIKSEIRRGTLNEGVTYKENIDSIKNFVTKDYMGTSKTAENAARSFQTDTQQTALDGLTEEEIVIKKTWLTMEDSSVREAHELLNGMTVDASERFVVPSGEWAGYEAEGPNTFGVDALDRNCRCYLIASVQPKDSNE